MGDVRFSWRRLISSIARRAKKKPSFFSPEGLGPRGEVWRRYALELEDFLLGRLGVGWREEFTGWYWQQRAEERKSR